MHHHHVHAKGAGVPCRNDLVGEEDFESLLQLVQECEVEVSCQPTFLLLFACHEIAGIDAGSSGPEKRQALVGHATSVGPEFHGEVLYLVIIGFHLYPTLHP